MKTTLELSVEEMTEAIKAYILSKKGSNYTFPQDAKVEPVTETELDRGEFVGVKLKGFKIEYDEALIKSTVSMNNFR